MFNVPGVVLAVLVLLALMHGTRLTLPADMAETLTLWLAFIPARWSGFAEKLPGGWPSAIASPLTHMLVHGDTTHLLLNAAWLLPFGSAIARRVGSGRFLAYAGATGVAGILLHVLAHWGEIAPVVGASGAVSGLMGGATRLLAGAIQSRGGLWALQWGPLASVAATLRNRQVLVMVAVWLALNLGMGLTGDLLTPGLGGIAWEAHVGGFLAGLLLLGYFDRPRLDPTVLLDDLEPG
jgi:membrane associated rhomboid family serine protease